MAKGVQVKPSIKIEELKENPLLDRKEVSFTILHEGASVPDRWTVRNSLAKLLKVPIELVFVISLNTRAGSCEIKGYARIYKNVEAVKVEQHYIYLRNLPRKEREEALKALKEAKRKVEKAKGGA